MTKESSGMSMMYCHGLPGGADELRLAGAAMPVLDRRQTSTPADLAAQLPEAPVHLVGFSLGAALALRLAAVLPSRVSRLSLISPAGPLELGDFLPDMAGRAVFGMARCPVAFRSLTALQALAVRFSPGLVARQLMATCDLSDTAFLSDPRVQVFFQSTLKQGYGANRGAYLREVKAYVRPWSDLLSEVRCPVALHHGTADLWAPFGMSQALKTALPDAMLTPHERLGHYTTLRAVLPTLSA